MDVLELVDWDLSELDCFFPSGALGICPPVGEEPVSTASLEREPPDWAEASSEDLGEELPVDWLEVVVLP